MPNVMAAGAGAAVLLLLVTAVGCGGSGGQHGVSTCGSPGVTPDRIELGVVYPDSGPAAPAFAAVRGGIEARLGLANEAGGIHGRRVGYVWRDDQANTEQNTAAVSDLVESGNVLALLEFSTAVSGGAGYLTQKGVPVTGVVAEQVWAQAPNMFSSAAVVTGNPVDVYGQYVRRNGGTRALGLTANLSAAAPVYTAKLMASMRAAGIADAGILTYAPGTDSPARFAEQIIQRHADVLIATTGPDSLAEVLAAARAAGAPLRVVFSATGYDRALLTAFGPALAGTSIFLSYRPFEAGGPAIETYRRAMARYAPQVQPTDQQFGIIAYIETDLMLRGLADAGPCPTRQGVIDALRALRDYDAGGLVAPTSVGHQDGRPTTCFAVVRVNAAGTGFDVMDPNLCGHEMTN